MWVDCILLAARHHAGGDSASAVLGLVVLLVLVVVLMVRAASAQYDLVARNGLPYCPRCDRQVSLRREFCRSCGYRFVTYGGSSPAREPASPRPTALHSSALPPPIPPPTRASLPARRPDPEVAAVIRRVRDGNIARDDADRPIVLEALKIQVEESPQESPKPRPGFMARYLGLSDLGQAAILGVAIALPAVFFIAWTMGGNTSVPEASASPALQLNPRLEPDALVYVVDRGVRYHKQGCVQLDGFGHPVPFRDASREFVPCRECWLFPEEASGPKIAAAETIAPPAPLGPVVPPATAARPVADVTPGMKWPVGAAAAPQAPAPAEETLPLPVQAVASNEVPSQAGPPVLIVRAPRVQARRTPRVEFRDEPPMPRPQETLYGSTATGITTYMGPRGGAYHYSKSGRKVYESSRRRR